MINILLEADFQKSCKPVKRVSVGAKVQVDASGAGDLVVGVVTDYDAKAKMVTICEAGTGELVSVLQPQLTRITDYWWEQILKSFDSEAEYEDEGEDDEDYEDEDGEGPEEDEAEEDEEEGEGEGEGGSVVKEKYKARYLKTVTSQGRVSLHNGDQVAQELAGMSVEDTYQYIATQTKSKAAVSDLSIRWSHLNKGQQRMLLGNWYRNWIRDFGDYDPTNAKTVLRLMTDGEKMAELVKRVKEYANESDHYSNGWDVIVETFTDREIEDEIKGATTLKGAVRKLKPLVQGRSDMRSEVESTAF